MKSFVLLLAIPKLRRNSPKWPMITSAKIPVVPVLRRKAASIAALHAKAVAARSSLIVTVVTRRAAATSDREFTRIDSD